MYQSAFEVTAVTASVVNNATGVITGTLNNGTSYTVNGPNPVVDSEVSALHVLGSNYKQWKLEMPRETFEGYLRRDVSFYGQVWRTAMTTPPTSMPPPPCPRPSRARRPRKRYARSRPPARAPSRISRGS